MTTLYLHIGTPKTGTSAIQRTMGRNRAFLETQNISYPDFGLRYLGASNGRNGHFLNEKDDPEGSGYELAFCKIRELNDRCDKIVLSEESLWREPERLPQFFRDLKEIGIQGKIIVYFRRQDLYVQSQYAQHVKTFMKKTFEEYVSSQQLYLDYYNRIQFFEELVGRENLIVRVYERQQFLNQDLVADFFAHVGIRDRERFVEVPYVNESLSGVYLETKRLLNRNAAFQCRENYRANFAAGYLKRAAAEAGDRASFSKNQYFSYEKQIEFLGRFQESNQKIAREYLGREDGILFYDEIPVPKKKVIKSRKYKLIKFLTETLDMEKFVRQYVKDLDADKSSLQYTKEQCVDVCGEIILMQQKEIEELKKQVSELNQKISE